MNSLNAALFPMCYTLITYVELLHTCILPSCLVHHDLVELQTLMELSMSGAQPFYLSCIYYPVASKSLKTIPCILLLQQSCAQSNTFNLTNSLREALYCVYVYLEVHFFVSKVAATCVRASAHGCQQFYYTFYVS